MFIKSTTAAHIHAKKHYYQKFWHDFPTVFVNCFIGGAIGCLLTILWPLTACALFFSIPYVLQQ